MKKRKIMIVTTSRADYGLLSPLIKKISCEGNFETLLTVTGSHLSTFHGNTIEQIISDGNKVDYQIKITTENDSENDICTSIANGLTGFSNILSKTGIDLIIVLGDRFELLSICIAAVMHKIPIAHLHGGEVTVGASDDCIRHSITKMSSFHFPSIELYKKRIIQMGENPERVFAVGAIGLDNIKDLENMSKEKISMVTGVDFNKNIALMTYHPVTLDDYKIVSGQVKNILNAILKTDLYTIITMPNADTGSRSGFAMMEEYARDYPSKFKIIKSMGQNAYMNAMKHAKLMVGNSSSGIIESASFKLPVVNIGDRQEGRFKPDNVIDCSCTEENILSSLNIALSREFKEKISNIQNPYGDGKTAERIVRIIETIEFSDKERIIKKKFYDLDEPIKQSNVE